MFDSKIRPFNSRLCFFLECPDCVVEGMFVDIILLHFVTLEKHPVDNFKPYPLSFSRKMQFSGNASIFATIF
jgi:hypothetical protein